MSTVKLSTKNTTGSLDDSTQTYQVTGSTKADKVLIYPEVNVSSMDLKAGNDAIHLPYDLSEYTAKVNKTTLILTDFYDSVIKINIASNEKDILYFADGFVNIQNFRKNISIGNLTLQANQTYDLTNQNDIQLNSSIISETTNKSYFTQITPTEGLYNFSTNGNYVVFTSNFNLVPEDTNMVNDVFVKNLQTGKISLLSTASNGFQGNYNSFFPSVSEDGRYVVFTSDANNLVESDTNKVKDVFIKDTQTGEIARVSTSSDDTQGNKDSLNPNISADGRYVTFSSDANNLVEDDTNEVRDIFLKDMQTGEIARVSTSSDNLQSNSDSFDSSVSANGSYLFFTSDADNLVEDDTNESNDIFMKDMQTGSIFLVSTASDGIQGNSDSYKSSVSSDGRYVVFESDANNLVEDDSNEVRDIFLKDMQTGSISLVSTASNGNQGNYDSYNPSVSTDGRYVVFESDANNLVKNDTNDFRDIFVKDMQTKKIAIVSVANNGQQANQNLLEPNISADGRYISFQGYATNLTEEYNSNATSFITPNPLSLALLSVTVDKASQIEGSTFKYTFKLDKALTKDTKIIYKISPMTDDLTSSDFSTANVLNIQTAIIKAGTTSTTVNIATKQDSNFELDESFKFTVMNTNNSSVMLGNSKEINATIKNDDNIDKITKITKIATPYLFSSNESYVAFDSSANDLVKGDINKVKDVFVKNVKTGNITLVSTASDGTQSNYNSSSPSVSANGRYVSFTSDSDNLVEDDTNESSDIFIKDIKTGNITLISTASDGTQGNYNSSSPSVSADGRYVIFSSDADNLIENDTNNASDIFLKDVQTGNITLISTASDGTQGNYGSTSPNISTDGRYVVFESYANNLLQGDTNEFKDIFVKDIKTGKISKVSMTRDGTQSNNSSSSPSVSADGHYISFQSDAINLTSENKSGYFITLNPLWSKNTKIDEKPFDLSVNVDNESQVEGSTFKYTFKLAQPNTKAIKINYEINYLETDETSFSGQTSGSVTFQAGETSKIVSIKTIDDSIQNDSPERAFEFQWSTTSTLTNLLNKRTINGVIIDNDNQNSDGNYSYFDELQTQIYGNIDKIDEMSKSLMNKLINILNDYSNVEYNISSPADVIQAFYSLFEENEIYDTNSIDNFNNIFVQLDAQQSMLADLLGTLEELDINGDYSEDSLINIEESLLYSSNNIESINNESFSITDDFLTTIDEYFYIAKPNPELDKADPAIIEPDLNNLINDSFELLDITTELASYYGDGYYDSKNNYHSSYEITSNLDAIKVQLEDIQDSYNSEEPTDDLKTTVSDIKDTLEQLSNDLSEADSNTKIIDLATVSTIQGDKTAIETFVFGKGSGIDSVKVSPGDKLSVGSIKIISDSLFDIPTDIATQTYALYTPATNNSTATLAIIDQISKNPLTHKVSITLSKTDIVTLSIEDITLIGFEQNSISFL